MTTTFDSRFYKAGSVEYFVCLLSFKSYSMFYLFGLKFPMTLWTTPWSNQTPQRHLLTLNRITLPIHHENQFRGFKIESRIKNKVIHLIFHYSEERPKQADLHYIVWSAQDKRQLPACKTTRLQFRTMSLRHCLAESNSDAETTTSTATTTTPVIW